MWLSRSDGKDDAKGRWLASGYGYDEGRTQSQRRVISTIKRARPGCPRSNPDFKQTNEARSECRAFCSRELGQFTLRRARHLNRCFPFGGHHLDCSHDFRGRRLMDHVPCVWNARKVLWDRSRCDRADCAVSVTRSSAPATMTVGTCNHANGRCDKCFIALSFSSLSS